MTNAEALAERLAVATIPDELAPIVTLAQTLARVIDDDEGAGFCVECKRGAMTASLASEYRKTLDALGQALLEADSAGRADVVSLLSAVGDKAG